MRRALLVLAFLCFGLASRPAAAGPPFVTDDPEPVEDGHYEINIAAIGLTERSGAASPAPMIDANWSAAPDLQLHVGLGLAYAEADGGVRAGYGDTELGIKYRFLHQDPEGWLPDVAFYPNIELPTGDAARGLGAGHVQLLLPIWIEKDWDRWSSYGGGGFWSNHHGADRNNWFVGWVLLRQITDSLQLGGEIYRQTSEAEGQSGTTGFNLGGTLELNDSGHLLFSAGRGLDHPDQDDRLSFYLGYQLTF